MAGSQESIHELERLNVFPSSVCVHQARSTHGGFESLKEIHQTSSALPLICILQLWQCCQHSRGGRLRYIGRLVDPPDAFHVSNELHHALRRHTWLPENDNESISRACFLSACPHRYLWTCLFQKPSRVRSLISKIDGVRHRCTRQLEAGSPRS